LKIPTLRLKKGTEKLPLRRHPWIFSGALESQAQEELPGSIVCVRDHSGIFIAYGQSSPNSQIRVRLCSWQEDSFPDGQWLKVRIEKAFYRRKQEIQRGEATLRLIFSEADNLPGLIADLLGQQLILQSDTAGADFWIVQAAEILGTLLKEAGIDLAAIWEKSDGDGRSLEGLIPRIRLLAGKETFDWNFLENGVVYSGGNAQKTGHYIDQRVNRHLISQHCTGAKVLDGFCHTGGMGLNALKAGAGEVWFADGSSDALERVKINLDLNHWGSRNVGFLEGDLFKTLRVLKEKREIFDVVILDPPKFAPKKTHIDKALAAYKDLALQGLELLREGGLLVLFSCSGILGKDHLLQATAYAAWDLRVKTQLIEEYRQSPCHPVPLSFPQASYLTGILIQKGDPL